jgi:hypothetical protein
MAPPNPALASALRAMVIQAIRPNIFKVDYVDHLQPDTPPKLSNRVREIPRWPYIVYSHFNIARHEQRSAFSDQRSAEIGGL